MDRIRRISRGYRKLPHRHGFSCLPSVLAATHTCLSALRPSFTRLQREEPRRLHSTSYLDGLRGVAALFVVFNHYCLQFFPFLTFGWGSGDDDHPDSRKLLLQLPVIRIIISGHFMVMIFFVISGFVLSHRALELSRRRQYTAVFKSLSSSVLRRWLRLMLPALVSTFLAFVLVRAGADPHINVGWDSSPPTESDIDPYMAGFLPTRQNSTLEQFIDCLKSIEVMMDPFSFGKWEAPTYNPPLWTLSIEFMGSLIVFMTVLCTGTVKPVLRVCIPAAGVVYCLCRAKWEWSLFFAGVFLAEKRGAAVSMLPFDKDSYDEPESKLGAVFGYFQTRGTILRKIPGLLAMGVLLFIGSWPENGAPESPGFRTLSASIPQYYADKGVNFYGPISAILLVWILEANTFMQAAFTTAFAQYLGDISFSIYVVHMPIIYSLGSWLVPKCLLVTKSLPAGDYLVGVTVGCSICLFITFCVADVFWRLVDVKSVQFAHWFAQQCMSPEEGEE